MQFLMFSSSSHFPKSLGIMVFHNLTDKLSPADAVPVICHQIPALLSLMLQSHSAQICPCVFLCPKLERTLCLLFFEGERQCVRRLKTVFLESTKVQARAQNLQFVYGRHTLRHQIELFPEFQ